MGTALLRVYDMYIGGTLIGNIQKDDSMQITYTLKGQMIEDVAGFPGTFSFQSFGVVPELTVDLYDADIAFLKGTIMNNVSTTSTSGALSNKLFGTKKWDHKDQAKEVILHPKDITDLSDQSEDIQFHLGVINPDGVVIKGSQENYQVYSLKVVLFPDNDQSSDRTYGIIGSRGITDTPLGVAIQFDDKANTPLMSVTALTMEIGQNDQLEAFALYGDVSSTSTASIANTSGYNATDTSMDFESLSGTFVAGYYKINSEIIYVGAVTVGGGVVGHGTVGILSDITRGCAGTTAASHSDTDTITYVTSASIERHTLEVTWASNNSSLCQIGNTYPGSGATRKGRLTHVATGAPTITATYGGVANTVVLTVTTT